MPGAEVADQLPLLSSDLEERLHLKSNKSLPRRRPTVEMVELPSPQLGSEGSSHPQHAPTPSLPLTPPGQIRCAFESETETWSLLPWTSITQDKSLTTAGSRQMSPPTPEITPPRHNLMAQKARPLFHIQPSISSQAESFQTALETLSSDDDQEAHPTILGLREQHPPAKRLSLIPRFPLLPNGPDDDETVSSSSITSSDSLTVRGLGSLDGIRSIVSRDIASSTSLSTHQPSLSKPSKRQNRTGNESASISLNGSPVKLLSATSPLTRDHGMHDRVQSSRKTQPSNKSTERFGEEIGWPPSLRQERREQRLLDRVDTWRLSTSSTTSTIEAVVIDSPPSAQRTLRHSEKRASLRSVTSPLTQSPHVSSDSGHDSPHRLVHKMGHVSEQNRRSFSSDASLPASNRSSLIMRKVERIPVVVIPQRASSLKASATPGYRPATVLRSTSSSRRPTTAPEKSKEAAGISRLRRRSLSGSISRTSRTSNRGREMAPPVIPARSSSLSAPTSRNNSRTTSLTSEGLRRHAESAAMARQRPREQTARANHNSLEVPHLSPKIVSSPEMTFTNGEQASPRAPFSRNTGDFERLIPASPLFSGQSVSSSPGPVEIMEATAVSLFAHNNKSLLLVNRPQPESAAVDGLLGHTFDTPPLQPAPAADPAVASPLRYEHFASEMPAVKVIPPTPVGLSRSLSDQSRGLSRRLGSMRRTLSGRRRSDTSGSRGHRTGFPDVGLNAINRKSGKQLDSKLHPFWRPRAFWDDDIHSYPDGKNNKVEHAGVEASTQAEVVFIGNSLGLPQHQVIITGGRSATEISNDVLVKGSGRLRKRPGCVMPQDATISPRVSIARPRSPYERHVRFASRFGTTMRQFSVKRLRDRLRRTRQRRALRQWEKRREQLKTQIGERTSVDPYAVEIQSPRPIH